MLERIKELGWGKIIFILLILASLSALLFYLFYCTPYMFHSDMATRLLLASEQMKTGQLYPQGWNNTTGMNVGLWEIILIPFMAMIRDWILCREIVVLIELILLVLSIIWFFMCMGENAVLAGGLCLIFSCFPLGQYEEGVYDASYTFTVISLIVVNILIVRILDVSITAKKKYYCLLGLLIFLSGYSSIRNYVVLMFPAFLCIVLYYWIEYRNKCFVILKKEKAHITLIILCVFCIATFIFYRCVTCAYVSEATDYFGFTDQIWENFSKYVQTLFSFYGASGNYSILSISGLRICYNFVFMVMAVFVAPAYFLINYNRIENKAVKIFTIYAWASDFVVVYMMIFSTATTPRYYTSVYFHNIMFLALFIGSYAKKVQKDIRIVVLILLTTLVGINHLSYFTETVSSARNQYAEEKQSGSLIDFLKVNELNYGVATYWHAYKNMCKSNGEIVIAGCLWNAETNELYPAMKHMWGNSESYYNPENYPGRSFLLLAETETVADSYYELASEVKKFKEYTILIFDQNLYSYDLSNCIAEDHGGVG